MQKHSNRRSIVATSSLNYKKAAHLLARGPTHLSNIVQKHLHIATGKLRIRQRKKMSSSPPFLRLPTEILQLIALELPVQSQAVIALTNKSLNFLIGTLSWKKLADESYRQPRTEFLKLLEKDVCAELWLCPFCNVLHLIRFVSFRDKERLLKMRSLLNYIS